MAWGKSGIQTEETAVPPMPFFSNINKIWSQSLIICS